MKVELLAPAGDLEKLKIAVSYGADAIYIGGEAFGLRSAAGNFTLKEMEKGIEYGHKYNKKIYLTLNTFPNEHEIKGIEGYLKKLNRLNLDAIIVADLGVFSLVKKITSFPIHISTQSSVCNSEALKFWKNKGASRVVLGREVTIDEAKTLSQNDIELEMFIHGSMCMSYSGKCTISNYTANRDANRGGCVNSCRWDYTAYQSEHLPALDNIYIMNSRDLWAVDHIANLINAGVHSLKIEGRMKSHLYLSTVVSAYRQILDKHLNQSHITDEEIQSWKEKLNSIPNRTFNTGFLEGRASGSSVLYDNLKADVKSNYLGTIREVLGDYFVLQVKNPFYKDDMILIKDFKGSDIPYKIEAIFNMEKEEMDKAQPNSLVYLKKKGNPQPFNVCSLA